MIRYFLITSIVTFFITSALAQSNSSDKIRLSLITPQNIDNLDEGQLSRLNSKLSDIVSQTGFSGDGEVSSKFVIYPKVLVNDIQTVETGLYKIYSASLDFTLVIMQWETKTIFQSTTFSQRGEGNSGREAIDRAIRSISVNNDNLSNFFTNSKKKIINYYETNCSDLMAEAASNVAKKQYEAAFSIYFTIPREVSCFAKIQSEIVSTYKKYQNTKCREMLQEAKSKSASGDFSAALNLLGTIDSESSCAIEADKLIATNAQKVSDQEARNFRLLREVYQTESKLEAKRIDAARDIAVEYFKSRPTKITYNTLILW